ncbi:hypothetical protein DQ384_26165 [Sphaerisporangium album]|uniref:Uncharacterized protein n=1 Tax=Sphaerisporangium album TaxID=509200 RepID=A0A367FBY4_9ACTN|nr:hypothetical protein [Sphaerisporangium album]RCG27207.1 hypothetical protein DQ384_26165 [Sphaerisporangium album]
MTDQPPGTTTTSPAAQRDRACRRWDGDDYCGATDDVRLYINGHRCPRHTPAAIAGKPEATGQYCAPGRHYCVATGTPCPSWTGPEDEEAVDPGAQTETVLALFDAPEPTPPAPQESDTVRRTRRQAEMLAAGIHPLSALLSVQLRLHPEAAPHDDRTAPGRRCGTCQSRYLNHRNFPKCRLRATSSEASDCRAWWPACVDHQPAPASDREGAP